MSRSLIFRRSKDGAAKAPSGYPSALSSARGVSLPPGSDIRPGELGGYYIDLSLKPTEPVWPPRWLRASDPKYIGAAQWALGCLERHRKGEGDVWLEAGIAGARHFLDKQAPSGEWLHLTPARHTFHVTAPWASAMAQGEGASLLVRAHRETGEHEFAGAALRALEPMAQDLAHGGLRAPLGAGFLLQEYPTDPPSHVLNGAIFALWGYYDVGVGLGDATALREFESGVASLAANVERWDTGTWSRYDLMPRRFANVASSFYHRLHIDQLRAMHSIAPRRELAAAAFRFEAYERSRRRRVGAFGRKALFRALVPRHPLLALRTPFASARGSARSGPD